MLPASIAAGVLVAPPRAERLPDARRCARTSWSWQSGRRGSLGQRSRPRRKRLSAWMTSVCKWMLPVKCLGGLVHSPFFLRSTWWLLWARSGSHHRNQKLQWKLSTSVQSKADVKPHCGANYATANVLLGASRAPWLRPPPFCESPPCSSATPGPGFPWSAARSMSFECVGCAADGTFDILDRSLQRRPTPHSLSPLDSFCSLLIHLSSYLFLLLSTNPNTPSIAS